MKKIILIAVIMLLFTACGESKQEETTIMVSGNTVTVRNYAEILNIAKKHIETGFESAIYVTGRMEETSRYVFSDESFKIVLQELCEQNDIKEQLDILREIVNESEDAMKTLESLKKEEHERTFALMEQLYENFLQIAQVALSTNHTHEDFGSLLNTQINDFRTLSQQLTGEEVESHD